MEIKNDKAFVRATMEKLNLLGKSNEEMETWAKEVTDISTAQQKIEAMAKEIRDTQQVVARILKYLL